MFTHIVEYVNQIVAREEQRIEDLTCNLADDLKAIGAENGFTLQSLHQADQYAAGMAIYD